VSWEVFRTVRPDGTVVAVARYVRDPDSTGTSEYLGIVERCPQCDERGYLYALYLRSKGGWRGPYYYIKHERNVYNRERYHELRARGVSSALASDLCRKTVVFRNCYFGRRDPTR